MKNIFHEIENMIAANGGYKQLRAYQENTMRLTHNNGT